MEKINCNICGIDDTRPFLSIEKGENSYLFVSCRRCGLVYLNPRPDEKYRQEFYDERYFDAGYIKAENIERLLKNANRIFNKLSPWIKDGRLLEIGTGVGCYLKVARDIGWEAHGVEISSFAVRYAKERFGLDLIQGEFREGLFQENYFDMVLMVHVIEHLSDPLTTLKELRRITKKTGFVYISTPNIASINFRRKKEKWEFLKIEEHLYFLSPHTLSKMLRQAGWRIIKMETENLMITSDRIAQIGLTRDAQKLRTFFNKHLSGPKEKIRRIYGYIRPGDSIEVLAMKREG